MVRQPEGDEEGVGDRPGAEDRRQHDVAQKAGQAREQRIAADGENPLDHCCLVTIAARPAKAGIERSTDHARRLRFPLAPE